MKDFKHYVLPAQVVLLFTVPAIMLTIVMSVIALMFVILGDANFYEITTSGPMAVIGFLLYLGFTIAMGQFMWEEK